MTSEHPHEDLQALIDGRLGADEQQAVEEHLAQCGSCRGERDVLAKTREALRGLGGPVPVDGGLEAQLRAAMDAEDATGRRWSPGTFAIAASLLIAALATAFLWQRASRHPDLPTLVARDYQLFRDGSLTLDHASPEAANVQQFFDTKLADFETRVFDLSMMQYLTAGGRVHRLGDQKSALFVYEGPKGETLVCQMYLGRVESLPEPSEIRFNDGITFYVFKQEQLTSVFWQEGEVVCVLVSDIEREQTVQLAFAKAVKV